MVKWNNKKWGDLLVFANGLVLAIIFNQLATLYFFRLDLTEEQRYTIKSPTRELLNNLDDDVYIEVYLEGNINAGFQRLHKAVRETLEEFRVYSHNKIRYSFVNPAAAAGQNAQQEFMMALAANGIQPMNVIATKDGQRTEKIVFPGALVSFGGAETGVMLVRGNRAEGSDEVLNQSIEGLEFEFANAIDKLSNVDRRKVGLIQGHGELDSLHMASLYASLLESFDVVKTRLDQHVLTDFDVLVLAKPTQVFSEQDKYRLDQYLMKGGKLLLLLDQLDASVDSASRENYFARPYTLGLEDQIFHYGARINQDAVQDLFSLRFPVITGMLNGKPQMSPIEWPFFPLINQYADHPITRNLDATSLKMASSIDTVKATGIRKTPLLFSSIYARKVMSPVRVNVNDLRKEIRKENFSAGPIVMAYLLEGKFTSVYRNRFLPEGIDTTGFRKQGVLAKIIVVGDGDLARNEINPRTGQPQPLGLDNFSGTTFANLELIMNMVAYLSNDSGLINARNKEVKIRPLDKEKIKNNRWKWQIINLALPIVLLVLLGILKTYLRKRKYGSFEMHRTTPDGN